DGRIGKRISVIVNAVLIISAALLLIIFFLYEYRHYFNENCEYKYTTSLSGNFQIMSDTG
ncbi:MAG: hypothetical protein ACLTN0_02970, partial [Coprococcus phoceensis]